MPKFSLSLLLLVILSCTDTRKEYYESGEIKAITKINLKKFDSIKKIFYKNGQIKKVVRFDSGRKAGKEKRYYKNGTLKEKILHDSLRNKKVFLLFHKNGQLKERSWTKDSSTVFYEEYNRKGELTFEMRKINTILNNDTIYIGDTAFINVIPYGLNLNKKRFLPYFNANLIKFNANAIKKANTNSNRFSFGRKSKDSFSISYSNPTKSNRTKYYTIAKSEVKEKVSHVDTPKFKFHFIPKDTGNHVLYGSYAVYLKKNVAKNFKNNILSYPFKVEFYVKPSN